MDVKHHVYLLTYCSLSQPLTPPFPNPPPLVHLLSKVFLLSSAEDTEDGGVAVMARTFPVYILLPIGAAFILESLWRRETSVPVVRAFCLQTYATWCFQCAHMLHAGNAFPGE